MSAKKKKKRIKLKIRRTSKKRPAKKRVAKKRVTKKKVARGSSTKAKFVCRGCKESWDKRPAGALALMWGSDGNLSGVCKACLKRKCSRCRKVHDAYWCCNCRKETDTVGFSRACGDCGKKKTPSYESARRKKRR